MLILRPVYGGVCSLSIHWEHVIICVLVTYYLLHLGTYLRLHISDVVQRDAYKDGIDLM